ncbi:mucin-5AC-like [Anneissia japonica]|uniref:mucin-5AC-like n=1 Tax=Anneissia japonica TaxID=1529436 RepID=UPI00142599DD|nr:mucin-5AC-like [Anneissia japonica]
MNDYSTIDITLHDINDNCPEFVGEYPDITIPLNTTNGTVITNISATDSDTGENGYITLSIKVEGDDSKSIFELDYDSGELTVSGYLQSGEYVIKVIASDNAEQPCITEKVFLVHVPYQNIVTTQFIHTTEDYEQPTTTNLEDVTTSIPTTTSLDDVSTLLQTTKIFEDITTSVPTTTNLEDVTTSVPTTSVPTTSVPTTSVPTTSVPTTSVPTTSVPTTSVPTTSVPTTSVPTTSVPTTSVPTTSVPTTSVPTTSVPTTTTLGDTTTVAPTTIKDVTTSVPITTSLEDLTTSVPTTTSLEDGTTSDSTTTDSESVTTSIRTTELDNQMSTQQKSSTDSPTTIPPFSTEIAKEISTTNEISIIPNSVLATSTINMVQRVEDDCILDANCSNGAKCYVGICACVCPYRGPMCDQVGQCFETSIRLTQLRSLFGDGEAQFSEALEDSTSQEFKDVYTSVKNMMKEVADISDILQDIKITGFRQGSIFVDMSLVVTDKSAGEQQVKEAFSQALKSINDTDITFDLPSLQVREVNGLDSEGSLWFVIVPAACFLFVLAFVFSVALSVLNELDSEGSLWFVIVPAACFLFVLAFVFSVALSVCFCTKMKAKRVYLRNRAVKVQGFFIKDKRMHGLWHGGCVENVEGLSVATGSNQPTKAFMV